MFRSLFNKHLNLTLRHEPQTDRITTPRGLLAWVNFCWVCAAGLLEPLPIIVYSVANYRPHLSQFGAKM